MIPAMRALVVCRDGYGHFHPMVPIACAVRDAGHDVLVACAAPLRAHVEAAGFPMADCGLPTPEARAVLAERFPEVAELPKDELWRMGHYLFAGVIAPVAYDDLIRIAGEWSPDVLLFETMEWAAPVVAARTGIPAILVPWGPARPMAWMEEGTRIVAPIWERAGLEPRPYGGIRATPLLDVCPALLQRPEFQGLPVLSPMRWVSYDGATVPLPAWVDEPRGRPLVYVTLGTVFAGNTEVFDVVLGALADYDADVLVAVGPTADPAALGPLPPSVRVERYVPQAALLPRCDLVVSHCGANTMMGAAEVGVPHLAVPQGADQFLNAGVLAASGAGRVLTGTPTADAVRAAVGDLLTDDAPRAAARVAADQIAERPHPRDVVGLIEEYAAR